MTDHAIKALIRRWSKVGVESEPTTIFSSPNSALYSPCRRLIAPGDDTPYEEELLRRVAWSNSTLSASFYEKWIMKMELRKALIIISAATIITGCENSDVSTVKNGIIENYNTTSIDKAFSASFKDGEWDSFETERGERVVKFSGRISGTLHNAAVSEILDLLNREDQKAVIEKHQTLEIAIEVFRKAGSNEILDLNQAYRCSPERNWAGLMIPNCDDEENNEKYLAASIEALSNELWKEGTPAEVEWVVHPNGSTFELLSMASPAWEGVEHQVILDAIYDK